MNTSQGAFSLKKPVIAIEWRLLAFLVLFMDVKLGVKVFAIVLTYILHPDFKFGFRRRNSRLPLFYLLVIAIAIFNVIIYKNFSVNYLVVSLAGILTWVACILAIHQVKLFVERTHINILQNTLQVFFLLNILFSLLNLLLIFMDIGLKNPFLYQGQYQKYFINTGDFIKGITFDTSTTNALINSFGVVYFLYQKKYWLVIASMATLLITASNFSNIIMLLVLGGIFLFKSNREQKSLAIVCMLLPIIFFAKISPQNNIYVREIIKNYFLEKKPTFTVMEKALPLWAIPDSLLTPDTRKEKIAVLFLDSLARERLQQERISGKKTKYPVIVRPEIPQDNINTAAFQWKRDTTIAQRELISYVQMRGIDTTIKYPDGLAGKVQSAYQSYNFLRSNPEKIFTGTGIGNFSSKLAFKATGLKIAGSFPERFLYCSPFFLTNHLSLYTYFFSKPAESHSIVHNPASVYDQLFTEYGILGIVALAVYYVGFFLRHAKKMTYGLPLLAILLSFFMIDYWFEQLSVVVLFELLMFTDMKEQKKIPGNE